MKKTTHYLFLMFIFILSISSACGGQPSANEDHPPQEIITKEAPDQIDGMPMVYVSAGDFLMGSHKKDNTANINEKNQRSVYLEAYWIDQFEVTNAQYAICVEEGVCNAPIDQKAFRKDEMADHPVVFVRWYDAQSYCGWAGRRLPTEAEWEKAARGIYAEVYPWGPALTCENANYADCNDFVSTSPVGTYADTGASVYGVDDLAGNVWEWTQDWYQDNFYAVAPDENPKNENSESGLRVIRGGSWNSYGDYLRSAHRDVSKPDSGSEYLGFRCVLPE